MNGQKNGPLYHTMLKAGATVIFFVCDFDLRVTELADAHIKGIFGPLHTNNPSIDPSKGYNFKTRSPSGPQIAYLD